jgi:hypothetical protein
MFLIWLRKQTPHLDNYRKCKDKYSPDRCFNSGYCLYCIVFSDNGECKYCGSDLSNEISICAITGSKAERMKKILRHAERGMQFMKIYSSQITCGKKEAVIAFVILNCNRYPLVIKCLSIIYLFQEITLLLTYYIKADCSLVFIIY